MPAGQPTKYREKYCKEVQTYMGQGYSLTAFAGSIGVSRDTIYEWARTHPSFTDAVKAASSARVASLERDLLSKEFAGPQITARIFALKNASPADWRDRHEHTGLDGGPISVVVARFVTDDPMQTIEGEVVKQLHPAVRALADAKR